MTEVEPLINVAEREEFQTDREAVAKVREYADSLAGDSPFKSREEAGEAAEAIRSLRRVRTDAEKRKLEITAPHRATAEAVNHAYNELLSPVKAAEAALKNKGLAWQKAEKAKAEQAAREEADRRQKESEAALEDREAARELAAEEPESDEAQELAEEAQRQAAAKAAATGAVAPRIEAGKARGTGGAMLHTRTEYRWEVADLSKVPPEFLAIDPAKVKGAIDSEKAQVKAGAKNRFDLEMIPGVRIWPEDIPVSR